MGTHFIRYHIQGRGSHCQESHSRRWHSLGSHSRGSHSRGSHSRGSHIRESPSRGSCSREWHSGKWCSRELHSFITLHNIWLLAFRCLIVNYIPFCQSIQFFCYSYAIIGFPGVSGYNTAPPPGPPPPNHPVGHSFHPLSQPAGVSVQPHQCMPPGFQMIGKFNLHHLLL